MLYRRLADRLARKPAWQISYRRVPRKTLAG